MPEKKKICPECGADLTGTDIISHRDGHWGRIQPDPRAFPDASKRWAELTDLAEVG